MRGVNVALVVLVILYAYNTVFSSTVAVMEMAE